MAKTKSPLGDTRLHRPFSALINAMGEKLSVVLRKLGSSRKEEVSFGRLVNNGQVSAQSLLKQYWSDKPLDLSSKKVLLIEDGSTLSFKLNPNRIDLGWVGQGEKFGGFDVHNSLMLDAEDLSCYGVASVQINKTGHRGEEERKRDRANCWKRPYESKETYRWYSTAEQGVGNCPGAASYTVVADRESDIYDAMFRFRQRLWDFVIRCSCDRRILENGPKNMLYAAIAGWPPVFTYKTRVSATAQRTEHEARLTVKFGTVCLLCPKSHPDKTLPPNLCVQVVEVREDPATVVLGEEAVHWILFTSHPVTNTEEALKVIKWYCARWNIEQSYRCIKLEGLDVEHSEADSFHALANIAVLALLAATQVMCLLRARNGQTQQKMDAIFSPQEIECLQKLNPTLEGNTQKQKNPFQPDSMAFATWVVARLGGWSGYASARPPGPITLVNGLTRFYAIYQGFVLRL